MPSAEQIFKALANRRRLALLAHLRRVPDASVVELSDVLHLSFRSTSKHLHVLRSAGLLDAERRGREMRYTRTPLPRSVIDTFVRMVR
ncbi:MAG: winged helix-turn-helix transcriptional regulator [Candidatus Kerfeldbacteria bacterium]|nr:winged helix-turn-helix transcriptional regulator [Candidatus Kerfeldbacteria bacterium]